MRERALFRRVTRTYGYPAVLLWTRKDDRVAMSSESEVERGRFLPPAQLLEYHRRDEKPAWWEYFHHLSLDDEELIEDGDTIGRARRRTRAVEAGPSRRHHVSQP